MSSLGLQEWMRIGISVVLILLLIRLIATWLARYGLRIDPAWGDSEIRALQKALARGRFSAAVGYLRKTRGGTSAQRARTV
jgi:hypothetical protein